MRIFITGGNGQLAKSVNEVVNKKDIIRIATKNELDILDKEQVASQIISFKPDIVFHFASMTRGDECAKYPDLAESINVIGTKNVVLACKKANSALLFVSTNEIFDGKKQQPYTETDLPHPITVVGKTKLKAEIIIKEHLDNYYIIRTSWLYSNWSQNFLHAVIKKAMKDKEIVLVYDEISSPTYSLDLAEALLNLIETEKYGTYHIANHGIVSRLEFAKKAFEIYDIRNITITPVSLNYFNRLSKPPLYSALKNTHYKDVKIHMPTWNIALKKFLLKHNLFT